MRTSHRERAGRSAGGAWLLVALLLGGVALPASGAPPTQAEEESLAVAAFAHLEAQCALGPRAPGAAGHQRCREYIHDVLLGCGGRVTLQSFRHAAPGLPQAVELTNILARFGPQRSGGLLLGAHWDTRPWADLDPDPARRDEPILGANDGASGTALLLALAERFRERPPPMPVILVFFDGEDLGRVGHPEEYAVGARYLAEHFPAPFPEAGLVIDMVASRSMRLSLEAASRRFCPDLAALVDDLALRTGLEAYDPVWSPSVIDDHIPLLQMGLPTLCLLDFRDPVWHTHADRPAACSPVNLGMTGRLLLALIEGGYFR
jgi:hypothetical protein